MKALVFENKDKVLFVKKAKPMLNNNDEVIVQVLASGVCGTDLKIIQGKFPAKKGVTLGHEAIGLVHAVSADVMHVQVGDRVVIDPTYFCGSCNYCLKGKVNFCTNKAGREVGVDYDGSHAEFIKIPAKFVYKLPADLSLEQAVLIEPLACVINNLTAADIKLGDKVLIYGGGPIGLLAAMLCQKWASKVVLVENNIKRANFAKKFIQHVVDDSTSYVEACLDRIYKLEKTPEQKHITKITHQFGGQKPNIVIDTVGMLLEQAITVVDKGGKIVLMGFNDTYQATIKPLFLTNNGIQLIGAGDYRHHIPLAIEMATELDIGKLVTHKFNLEDYQAAFELLNNPLGNSGMPMKVIFTP